VTITFASQPATSDTGRDRGGSSGNTVVGIGGLARPDLLDTFAHCTSSNRASTAKSGELKCESEAEDRS
jgi:hypothetical protein